MEMKFYRCPHCGQIIAIVKATGVPIVCCGEPMAEVVPGTTDNMCLLLTLRETRCM